VLDLVVAVLLGHFRSGSKSRSRQAILLSQIQALGTVNTLVLCVVRENKQIRQLFKFTILGGRNPPFPQFPTAWNWSEADFDLSRFDRRYSIINRPLPAMNDEVDPLLLIAPIFISDACMYSLSGLMNGNLNNNYWHSDEAGAYAGKQGHAAGEKFEDSVAARLRKFGMEAWSRRELSWALSKKFDAQLGNIDVLAISPDRRRVWVIETKNLKLCRTEAEVASRLSEYRGRTTVDSKGREKPDKMLRHIRRVRYLRERNHALCRRLKLDSPPEVKGLIVVDSPQPMNFYAIGQLQDGESAFLRSIESFDF
jgi:hypothetical protein